MKNIVWFEMLKKPFLVPPSWLFTPIWLILYLTMILSLLAMINADTSLSKKVPLLFFLAQLLLNLSWSPVFFGMQNIGGALVICILMWVMIGFTILKFYQISMFAGILLVPYFLWVTFAMYLNFMYFVLNR